MRSIFIIFVITAFQPFAQNYDWVQTIGLGGNNVVWDAATDSQGNVFTTGRVKFTVRFGLAPAGIVSGPIGAQTDGYLFKLSPQGDTVWAKRFGGVDPDWSRGIAIDQYDNIYITGEFCNMAVFENDTIYGYNNGSTDPTGNALARSGFIAKYDNDGNLVWVNKFQGGDHCRSYAIDIDSQGNSYITGIISGLTQFDAQTTGENNALQLGFIAKYDPNGVCIWANYVDSPFNSVGNDIKVLNDSQIIVTGYYKSNSNYLGNNFSGASSSWGDFFLLSIDENGDFNWIKTGTGSYNIAGNDIAISDDNKIYVVGHFAQTMNLGSISLTSMGTGTTTTQINANRDSFIAKYDQNGNLIWVNQIGNDTLCQFDAIQIIDNSKVIVGGYTMDTIIVTGIDTIIPYQLYPSTVVMTYDSSGNYLWNMQVNSNGTNADNAIKSIAVDIHKNIFLGGWYDNFATWGTTTIEADNGYDAFIVKLFPPLNPNIIGDTSFCLHDTAQFTSSYYGHPIIFDWVTANNNLFFETNDSADLETVTVNDDTLYFIVNNGYEIDTSIFILSVHGLPQINLGNDTTICIDSSLTLFAGPANFSYNWGTGFLLGDSILTVNSPGNYAVYILDTNGCINYDEIAVNLTNCFDNIQEQGIATLNIIPNPASNYFEVFLNNNVENQHIELINAQGKIVKQEPIKNGKNLIEISDLVPGVYIVNIYSDNWISNQTKLIKVN